MNSIIFGFWGKSPKKSLIEKFQVVQKKQFKMALSSKKVLSVVEDLRLFSSLSVLKQRLLKSNIRNVFEPLDILSPNRKFSLYN